MDAEMAINFISHESSDHESLIEVHLGPVLHGYIIRTAPQRYHYFRIVNNKAIPRHEADNVDVLKQMVLKVP